MHLYACRMRDQVGVVVSDQPLSNKDAATRFVMRYYSSEGKLFADLDHGDPDVIWMIKTTIEDIEVVTMADLGDGVFEGDALLETEGDVFPDEMEMVSEPQLKLVK